MGLKDGRFVHSASLMDLCHLKRSELATHLQKYQGRVVLLWNRKDDSGYSAVTEQGAAVSQMAATFLDTMSRLHGTALAC